MAGDRQQSPGRWRTLSAAPHRLMFLGGVVQMLVAVAWWGIELTGRYTGAWGTTTAAVPATWVHAYLMLYTLFPFFIFGFLMTTYPRWMAGPEVPRAAYIRAFVPMALGVVLFYAGAFWWRPLAVVGVGVHLLGLVLGFHALWRVYAAVRGRAERYYETQINFAFGCAIAGELAYLVWLAGGSGLWLTVALRTGFWLFLLPILVVVAHRMLPFFSVNALPDYRMVQPRWTLPLLWSGVGLHWALSLAGAGQWLFVPDLALAAMGFYHSARWQFRRSLSVRLLAALHIAFLGFAVGMTLLGLQSLWWLVSGRLMFGFGPFHLLAIGFVMAMMVGMVTRVSLGHSGRPLVMSGYAWGCFLGVELTALWRFLGGALGLLPQAWWFNLAAAASWLLFLGAWAVRFGPFYWRPRVDGRPG